MTEALRCANCGKTMAEHGPLANCWSHNAPGEVAGQEDALRRGGDPASPGFDRHFDTMHAGCSSDWSVGSEPHFCNEEIDHDGPHRCRCGVRHTPEHVYEESGGGDCGVCGRDPDDENHI